MAYGQAIGPIYDPAMADPLLDADFSDAYSFSEILGDVAAPSYLWPDSPAAPLISLASTQTETQIAAQEASYHQLEKTVSFLDDAVGGFGEQFTAPIVEQGQMLATFGNKCREAVTDPLGVAGESLNQAYGEILKPVQETAAKKAQSDEAWGRVWSDPEGPVKGYVNEVSRQASDALKPLIDSPGSVTGQGLALLAQTFLLRKAAATLSPKNWSVKITPHNPVVNPLQAIDDGPVLRSLKTGAWQSTRDFQGLTVDVKAMSSGSKPLLPAAPSSPVPPALPPASSPSLELAVRGPKTVSQELSANFQPTLPSPISSRLSEHAETRTAPPFSVVARYEMSFSRQQNNPDPYVIISSRFTFHKEGKEIAHTDWLKGAPTYAPNLPRYGGGFSHDGIEHLRSLGVGHQISGTGTSLKGGFSEVVASGLHWSVAKHFGFLTKSKYDHAFSSYYDASAVSLARDPHFWEDYTAVRQTFDRILRDAETRLTKDPEDVAYHVTISPALTQRLARANFAAASNANRASPNKNRPENRDFFRWLIQQGYGLPETPRSTAAANTKPPQAP
jgi:hypothetical protein